MQQQIHHSQYKNNRLSKHSPVIYNNEISTYNHAKYSERRTYAPPQTYKDSMFNGYKNQCTDSVRRSPLGNGSPDQIQTHSRAEVLPLPVEGHRSDVINNYCIDSRAVEKNTDQASMKNDNQYIYPSGKPKKSGTLV